MYPLFLLPGDVPAQGNLRSRTQIRVAGSIEAELPQSGQEEEFE
jgi:hypothetical protein